MPPLPVAAMPAADRGQFAWLRNRSWGPRCMLAGQISPAGRALGALDRNVLEGRGVWKAWDRPERGMADPGPGAVEKAELPDRREHHLLVDELLHLSEDRTALFLVEFVGLLRIERVDVGVAAIGEGAALDGERGHPGRRIAERAARAADRPAAVLLAGVRGDKPGALDRLQCSADAHCLEIVDADLADVGVGRVDVERPRVEAARVAGGGQEFFGLVRVVHGWWRLPKILERVGHQGVVGDLAIAEKQSLTHPLAVERQIGSLTYPHVVPR